MTGNNIQLSDKLVGEIEGEFYIPSYQRGYRWDETQVRALLDDVYINGDKPYCLQPIVVRKNEYGRFELIDGQQRLTTLFIIYKYMVNRWPDYIEDIKYSLVYETRKENADFFMNIEDEEKAQSNVDFYFINKAYKTVENWFAQDRKKKALHVASKLTEYFDNNVKVIWYELQSGTEADAISLFTRLNIGRIPLTNAELVKALFLCKKNIDKDCRGAEYEQQLEQKRQLIIALQWDTMERELHDDDFWCFLTRKNANDYPTRIELIFDFMAPKDENERDPYRTFLWFNSQKDDLQKLWEKILLYYYRLKEWYRRDELYHKIGYLVASCFSTIDVLMQQTEGMKKKSMEELLDQYMKDSIHFDKPYSELSYEKDYDEITRILLLFNVVSLMKNKAGMRFPFKEFNTEKWSLEHIHAQNSLKLNTQEKWKRWLKDHLNSVKGMMTVEGKVETAAQLFADINAALEGDKLTDVLFTSLSDRVTRLLSEEKGGTEYVHSLSNMALLQASANSALSNGLFDAKRREIIKMDSDGKYIPYCTKMVFLKYYTSTQQSNITFHYWTEEDRKCYIDKMNETLEYYRAEEIRL